MKNNVVLTKVILQYYIYCYVALTATTKNYNVDAAFLEFMPTSFSVTRCARCCKRHMKTTTNTWLFFDWGNKKSKADWIFYKTRMLMVTRNSSDGDSQEKQQQQQQQQKRRSVSDYMGGHHAGKFDFDSRLSGVTNLNYEKSLIFDDLSLDGKTSSNVVAPIPNEEDGSPPLPPTWSTRSIDYSQKSTNNDDGILYLQHQSKNNDNTIVLSGEATLLNDEISWEPFYATIEDGNTGNVILHNMLPSSSCGDNDLIITVTPTNGNLAPRGGVPSYSDSCVFTVTATVVVGSGLHEKLYLAVRTEQDFWSWRLVYRE